MKTNRNQVRALCADFSAVESPALFVIPAPSHCTHAPHSSALDLADRLINDRTISAWLSCALVHNLNRDLVDAINDAELLLSVLTARLEELQGGAS